MPVEQAAPVRAAWRRGAAERTTPSPAPPRLRIAYLVSRFPKITETFILYEILAVERQGIDIELYPLWRERTSLVHPEAVPLVERAHFLPFLSWKILCAHAYFLGHRPRAYLGALAALLGGTWGSLRYFAGAVAFFPKVVCFAHDMAAAGVRHVHAHFASHPAAAALLVHRLTGIPYSFTAHGSDLHRDRRMLPEKVAEAAFVVPISRYNRELIVQGCGEACRPRLVLIHCGADTRVFQPRASSGNGPSPGGPLRIVCVGTMHEVKGQAYLIEACRLLAARGIPFHCDLVGDGPDLRSLTAAAARAGIDRWVSFHGRRTRDEVARLLADADVMATPSVPTSCGRREGIPVVLMEAMASGLAVVASDLSGIPELVVHDETGLLVQPRDAPGLADALERLAREPALRARLGQAARSCVLESFSMETNAALLAERFRRAVNPPC